MRKKVAVYIDHALRIPNFVPCFEQFKSELFSDKNVDLDTGDEFIEGDIRFYWTRQMEIPEISDFYLKKITQDMDNDEIRDYQTYFYNDEHYKRFLEQYSFNLYVDCIQPNKGDTDVLNISQANLFDIVLVDEYASRRKIGNTLFYLSKLGLHFHSLVFLGWDETLNKDEYFGIWNPKDNPEQVNKRGNEEFLNFFKFLERKNREENEFV